MIRELYLVTCCCKRWFSSARACLSLASCSSCSCCCLKQRLRDYSKLQIATEKGKKFWTFQLFTWNRHNKSVISIFVLNPELISWERHSGMRVSNPKYWFLNTQNLVKLVMSILIYSVHMTFYILTTGYTVPGNKGTHE